MMTFVFLQIIISTKSPAKSFAIKVSDMNIDHILYIFLLSFIVELIIKIVTQTFRIGECV